VQCNRGEWLFIDHSNRLLGRFIQLADCSNQPITALARPEKTDPAAINVVSNQIHIGIEPRFDPFLDDNSHADNLIFE
jgi:hypothetical protein